jgi:hypothetical protein
MVRTIQSPIARVRGVVTPRREPAARSGETFVPNAPTLSSCRPGGGRHARARSARCRSIRYGVAQGGEGRRAPRAPVHPPPRAHHRQAQCPPSGAPTAGAAPTTLSTSRSRRSSVPPRHARPSLAPRRRPARSRRDTYRVDLGAGDQRDIRIGDHLSGLPAEIEKAENCLFSAFSGRNEQSWCPRFDSESRHFYRGPVARVWAPGARNACAREPGACLLPALCRAGKERDVSRHGSI